MNANLSEHHDDISLRLIELKMRGNAGLAPASWRRQLSALRSIPVKS